MRPRVIWTAVAGTTLVAGASLWLLLRQAADPPPPSPALRSLETSLARFEERLARLEDAVRSGAAFPAPPMRPDERGVSDDTDDDLFEDGDEVAAATADGAPSADDAALVARVDALETRLRGLEEDPIQRGYSFLASQHADLRRQGVYALESLASRDPQARAAIREMLNDADAEVRRTTIDTLADIGDKESAPWILGLLEDESANVRREAIDALSRLDAGESGVAIAGLLGDEDTRVREAAADALGDLRTQEAESALLRALQDPEQRVRGEAIASLGEIDARGAAPALRAIWDEDPGPHRFRLAHALRRLGDPAPFEQEFRRLSDEARSGESPDRRRSAVRALAALDRRQAEPVLRQATEDPDAGVRREAERALRGWRR